MSKVNVIDHPLIKHKLALIRDKNTEYWLFRYLVKEISYILLYEATRDLRTKLHEIETPLMPATAELLDDDVVVIPILRAGVGMLEGCLSLIPIARVGFAGVYREEGTLQPVEYYYKAPDIENSKVLVLDPMLATGGSVSAAISKAKERGAKKVKFICILASPDGIDKIRKEHPDVEIFCASIDKGLDSNGFIFPGLGDCGDRLYGTE